MCCPRHRQPHVAGGTQRLRPGKGIGCKWLLNREEAMEGWGVSEVYPHSEDQPHNHELAKTQADRFAHSRMRDIPEHLLAFGAMSQKAG